MLEVRDLRVRYGPVEAVRGINLSIRRGELVALIGSNGAGKSTFLKALAGILRPVSGNILFEGEELAAAPAHHGPPASPVSTVNPGPSRSRVETRSSPLRSQTCGRRVPGCPRNLSTSRNSPGSVVAGSSATTAADRY